MGDCFTPSDARLRRSVALPVSRSLFRGNSPSSHRAMQDFGLKMIQCAIETTTPWIPRHVLPKENRQRDCYFPACFTGFSARLFLGKGSLLIFGPAHAL